MSEKTTQVEYNAAAALTGILGRGDEWDMSITALAYQIADEMLKAREQ
jgi:hypothetical protein